jgi:sugar lactone lactonase YvrE
MTVGAGSIWVATEHGIVRVNPNTDRVTALLPLPPSTRPSRPGLMAVSGRLIWLTMIPIDDTPTTSGSIRLWSFDTGTGKLVGAPIVLPSAVEGGILAAAGSLWVTNGDHAGFGRLYQVDPSARRIENVIPIPDAPASIASTDGLLWVAESDSGVIVRVDPSTGAVAGLPIRTGGALLTLAAAHSTLWVADSYRGRLLRIDARTGARTLSRRSDGIWSVTTGGDAIWALQGHGREVAMLSSTTGAPLSSVARIGHGAESIVAGYGAGWLTTEAGLIKITD